MSQQFDCSNGLPKALCLAFIQWDPNWKQRTQEQRVILIRTFAEYLIRHEIPAYLVDFSIVTKRNEDFKPYIFTHSQISDIFNAADSIHPHSSNERCIANDIDCYRRTCIVSYNKCLSETRRRFFACHTKAGIACVRIVEWRNYCRVFTSCLFADVARKLNKAARLYKV